MIILVDQDGPLADLEQGFLDAWRKQYPNEFYVPLDQRTTFYIEDMYPKRLQKKARRILTTRGFFLNLKPHMEGIAAIKELVAMGHEVYICTIPMKGNDQCALEKTLWIKKHIGKDFLHRVIFTSDKTLIHGAILLDDRPEMTGIKQPCWEHVIFDMPYNRHITHRRRVVAWQNWRDLIEKKHPE